MIQPPPNLPNTLRLPAVADEYVEVESADEAVEVLKQAKSGGLRLRGLGEGSNVVLMPKVEGVVCRVSNARVTVVAEDSDWVIVNVGAGRNWHELVEETLAQGWFGLENLALIPGSVGAAPIQNIGAYGVELAQFVESVMVVTEAGGLQHMNAEACGFGYRDSVFKRHQTQSIQPMIIAEVRLRLSKVPRINIAYTELATRLDVLSSPDNSEPLSAPRKPSPRQVADAVMDIRRAKLPDPSEYPNAGSFFKNPIVSNRESLRLRELAVRPYRYEDRYKVSAAQLIDLAGWKGERIGDVGCWEIQPLVLVNYGDASAQNLLDFAQEIQRSVKDRFQLELELEPSVVS